MNNITHNEEKPKFDLDSLPIGTMFARANCPFVWMRTTGKFGVFAVDLRTGIILERSAFNGPYLGSYFQVHNVAISSK